MPPQIALVLGIVNLALKAAPEVEKVYENARALFDMWFKGGLITAAQQSQLMDWADQHEADVLAGKTPVEFTVEADPE